MKNNDDLLNQIDELKKENDSFKKQIQGKQIPGWVIKTPLSFSGAVNGVVFSNGSGFIHQGKTPEERKLNELKARQIQCDFGYQVDFVEDFLESSIPELDEGQPKTIEEYLQAR